MRTKGPAIGGARASWKQLSSWPSKAIFRGTVFRCLKAVWPYENVVDFMVVIYPESPCGFALIVTTGYKAGHILVQLPAAAKAADMQALSTDWIIANWTNWIYPDCPLQLVQVIESYPSQIRIEDATPSIGRNLQMP
ncbi:Imm45 family immunity protein [Comamonas sediminis]|uniref:Imm45 family immunity protein n=1 Tax=Comamonas sediminis TaxID=1783360 RepID=UPI003D2BB3AE